MTSDQSPIISVCGLIGVRESLQGIVEDGDELSNDTIAGLSGEFRRGAGPPESFAAVSD